MGHESPGLTSAAAEARLLDPPEEFPLVGFQRRGVVEVVLEAAYLSNTNSAKMCD
jgi:hypothetical protein